MRLRFRSITYAVGGTPASLERHYRELRESMLRAGAHYGLQPSLPWRPPIDIHETPDAIVVKMELAGVSEDHIDITLYDNALVVSGQRENDIEPDESVYYHEAQVRYGPFRADVLLPIAIEPEAVQATYEYGFLRIRLPKASAARHKNVPVDATADRAEAAPVTPESEHDDDHDDDHDDHADDYAEASAIGVTTVADTDPVAHVMESLPEENLCGRPVYPHARRMQGTVMGAYD